MPSHIRAVSIKNLFRVFFTVICQGNKSIMRTDMLVNIFSLLSQVRLQLSGSRCSGLRAQNRLRALMTGCDAMQIKF